MTSLVGAGELPEAITGSTLVLVGAATAGTFVAPVDVVDVVVVVVGV